MPGRMEGKVAFITGAARGQGRSHAIRLAEEGAGIIAVDLCEDLETVAPHYPLATEADLAETRKLVEELGRRIIATKADVRDLDQLQRAFDEGFAEFGRIDTVVANAGILSGFVESWKLSPLEWQETIDVNLTGVWHTTKVAIPSMIDAGNGGSLILTSSIGGLKGFLSSSHYCAAKHGVVGLMRTLANELAPHMIRVNSVHPTNVNTMMLNNEGTYGRFLPGELEPTQEKALPAFSTLQALPIPWVETRDISNAILFLASDEARYVTGATFTVDAGAYVK